MMESRGFTVLELLVAISVGTILLTIGIPSFMQILAENRRVSYTAEVFNAFNYARSEAISRNVNVVICKSLNGTSCTTGSNWEDGWLIYANLEGDLDPDDIGNGEPDSGDIPLTSNQGLDGYRMTALNSDHQNRITYLAAGRVSPTGDFSLCPENGKIEGRIIRINAAGRATTPELASPDCTVPAE